MKECCKESDLSPIIVDSETGQSFRRCQVCQARHFEMTADPGVYNIKDGKEATASTITED